MFARLLPVLMTTLLLGVACGGGDDASEPASSTSEDRVDAGAASDDGDAATVDADSTTSAAPTTTETIPPEARELPDLQIVFVQFGSAGYVEIANFGENDADVSGIQLLQSSTAVDLGTVIAGSMIPAGGSVQVGAENIGGLQIEGGEAALYAGAEVGDPDAILAFVQWGTGGTQSDVAAAAGIWPAGATVEPSVEFNSIELGGDPADPESWS